MKQGRTATPHPRPRRSGRCRAAAAPGRRRRWARTVAAALVLLLAAPPHALFAQSSVSALADLSLEELMEQTVVSAAKKPTSVLRTPAAVSVLTREDIRRLGITSLPEALRWVAGMNVARINAHQWAISARGFQGLLSDKLLVMIDGRTLHDLTFPGVHWDSQDVVFEDLDRIEVVRGPLATLWGASAVNGVVNIITRHSRETLGTVVSVAAGTEEKPVTSVRHGGRVSSDLSYRLYAKHFDRDGLVNDEGEDAPYDWEGLRGGFRLDWEPNGRDTYFVTGEIFAGETHQDIPAAQLTPPFALTTNRRLRNESVNLLGRWTRAFSESSELSLQGFIGRSEHPILGISVSDELLDLALEHRFSPAVRHDVVWGVGIRQREGRAEAFGRDSRMRFSGFLQDEIALVPGRVHLVLGSKLEHNEHTGLEWSPGVRLLWTPDERRSAWASVSHALSEPDPFERDGASTIAAFQEPDAPFPAAVRVLGNRDLDSEELVAYELGYRFQAGGSFSLSLATFYHDYDELIEFLPAEPFFEAAPPPPHLVLPLVAQNFLSVSGYGIELSAEWRANPRWRLAGDYSWMRFDSSQAERTYDYPPQVARLRSYFSLTPNWELNGAAAYTDALEGGKAPAHVRLDLGLVFHAGPHLEVGLWGQNLLESRHSEFLDPLSPFRGEVSRGAVVRVTWRP